MRRPFFWPALSLGLGIFARQAFFVPKAWLVLAVFSLLPFLWTLRGKRFFLPLFCVSLGAVGMLRAELVQEFPQHHISRFARGEWGSLQGTVDSLPEFKERGKRKIYSFLLRTENLFYQKELFSLTGRVQVFLFNPGEVPGYGSRVRLWGKLELPRSPRNPGEFDYREYLAGQGIHAIFEGYGPRTLRRLEGGRNFWGWPLEGLQRLRQLSAERLDQIYPPPVNGLLKALLLGIRKGLPDELRDDFVKTGTIHLVAISGMNITLVAGGLFFLALVAGLPQKGAAAAGLLSAVAYVFLSGAGIPVVRAGWMAALFFAGLLLEREKDLLNSLYFAFFAIVAVDPEALFQVGFQLSFLSVLCLALLAGRGGMDWPRDLLQTFWILVGTFPLCAVYFSIFSWVALFTNLLAIPLFHLGVFTGLASLAASGIPVLAPLLAWGSTFFLKSGLAWIHAWAEQPWGYFHLRPPSTWLITTYYAALSVIYAGGKLKSFRFRALRVPALSIWFLVTALFFLPTKRENLVLTIFAAGQNELLHAEFPGGRHWLVNAGRGAPSDQARWLLGPFLRERGVKRLQGILLTDLARRHTGGLSALLSNFSVNSILLPYGGKLDLRKRPAPLPLRRGDRIPVGAASGFQVLDIVDDRIFLLIEDGGRRFIFLPTWNPEALKQVLPRLEAVSPVEAVLFPASGEPSAAVLGEVLRVISPRWAVFSKQKESILSLPVSVRDGGVSFLFLADTGALQLTFGKGPVQASEFLRGAAENR
jgi:competence protein ComEC